MKEHFEEILNPEIIIQQPEDIYNQDSHYQINGMEEITNLEVEEARNKVKQITM